MPKGSERRPVMLKSCLSIDRRMSSSHLRPSVAVSGGWAPCFCQMRDEGVRELLYRAGRRHLLNPYIHLKTYSYPPKGVFFVRCSAEWTKSIDKALREAETKSQHAGGIGLRSAAKGGSSESC